MRVRIGITDTSKVVEVDAENIDEFKSELERAMAEGGFAWFTDTKGRSVGIPASSVAFVEIEGADGGPSVGFAPAM
jgi:hypothetical protein